MLVFIDLSEGVISIPGQMMKADLSHRSEDPRLSQQGSKLAASNVILNMKWDV